MPRLAWLFMSSLLLLGSASLPISPAAGQEKSKRPKASAVTVGRCYIKLIDEVTLAGGRTGILAFVEPREGDAVRKDQQVAGVVDDVAVATFNVAEKEATNDVEIRFAKAARDVAKAELDKAVFTNEKVSGTVPDIEVKKLELAHVRAGLQIEQAENQFEINKLKRDEARENLKLFKILAPFDGVVTRVYKAKGEAVREGDPILELSSTARVRVEGYVAIKDVWNIAQGSPVKVQLEVPDADLEVERLVFEGKIVFLDVKVQPVDQTVRVWAEVANKDNVLRAGLTAKMTIFPGHSGSEPAAALNSK